METSPRVECPHCGQLVEATAYCGACGRPLAADAAAAEPPSRRRFGALLPLAGAGLRPEQIGTLWRAAAIGCALVLVLLLANASGLAIVVGACVVPVVLVIALRSVDVFEREPALGLLIAAVGGFLAGMVVAVVNDLLADELWLDGAQLNIGAAGFGGPFADAAGAPPASLLLLSGLVIPIAAEALKVAAPTFLRRWPMYRNEVMDGVILGATAGAGFAAAGAIVYFWPLIAGENHPGLDTAEWTAMLLGLVLVRPAIISLIGAMLGAGIWHYQFTYRQTDAIRAAAPAVGGAIIFALVDLVIQPSGALIELIWGLLVLVGLSFASRGVFRAALARDRTAVGPETGRQLCPTCGAITPAGAFCARCGSPLPEQSLATNAAVAEDNPSTADMTRPLDPVEPAADPAAAPPAAQTQTPLD